MSSVEKTKKSKKKSKKAKKNTKKAKETKKQETESEVLERVMASIEMAGAIRPGTVPRQGAQIQGHLSEPDSAVPDEPERRRRTRRSKPASGVPATLAAQDVRAD